MQSQLFEFFIGLLHGNEDSLNRARSFPNDPVNEVSNALLIFTLPQIYNLLEKQISLDYQTFRKQLYQSKLNESLRKYNAAIEVHQTSGHVDTTQYKLVRINSEL